MEITNSVFRHQHMNALQTQRTRGAFKHRCVSSYFSVVIFITRRAKNEINTAFVNIWRRSELNSRPIICCTLPPPPNRVNEATSSSRPSQRAAGTKGRD